ncbi:chaperonin 10-like protein [Amylocystis lapponica]|nr:chaperonin 10-like protein [Amylocystis lapponica]
MSSNTNDSGLQFKGYALTDSSKWTNLKVTSFQPKTFQPEDVELAITHCGWGESKLPLVAGHEIVGIVTRVGDKVKTFKPGDRVGVGPQIGSCLQCRACKMDYENYCPDALETYNGEYPDGVVTQGGYSTAIRAHERFVFPIPNEIESRDAATMFCAGLTVYSPLKTYGMGPGKKVGVIGIGGLGHFAVLFGKAMGAEVYAFTHDKSKLDDIKKMGADHIVYTGDKDFAKPYAATLDLIISTRDTYDANASLSEYLSMLFIHGKFISVGIPNTDNPLPAMHPFDFAPNGCLVGGSHAGSKKECMEMLELARAKGVRPWIEELPMKDAGKALKGVQENTVRYRYVLTQDLR